MCQWCHLLSDFPMYLIKVSQFILHLPISLSILTIMKKLENVQLFVPINIKLPPSARKHLLWGSCRQQLVTGTQGWILTTAGRFKMWRTSKQKINSSVSQSSSQNEPQHLNYQQAANKQRSKVKDHSILTTHAADSKRTVKGVFLSLCVSDSIQRVEAVKPTPAPVLGLWLCFRPPWQIVAAVTPCRPQPDRLHMCFWIIHKRSSKPSSCNRKEAETGNQHEAGSRWQKTNSKAELKDDSTVPPKDTIFIWCSCMCFLSFGAAIGFHSFK